MNAIKEVDSTTFLPSLDCALMKKRGSDYLSAIDNRTVTVVTTDHYNNCPYILDIPELTDAHACYYVIAKFVISNPGQTFLTVPAQLGFDTDFPPNKEYAFLVLYAHMPNDAVFSYMRKRNTGTFTQAQMLASINMLRNGMKLDQKDTLLPTEFFKKIASESVIYTFTKFKAAEFHNKLAGIKAIMDKDPAIALMVNQLSQSNQSVRKLLNG